MASPEILDFQKLLTPIPGDNPAGANLREDFSPGSVYQAIKAARTKARAAERKKAEGDESAQVDWSPLLDLVPDAIATKSKDLEIAAWLTEALIREHGFPGLRDGFRLMRELVEGFWDKLYPLPDEEGVGSRVAALGGLNGLDGEGTLIGPIHNVPLTEEANGVGPFARWHYKQADDLEGITDPEKREKRIAAGAVTKEMIGQAETGTSLEFIRTILEDLSKCQEEFSKLTALLDEKCGKDESGQPLSPPSSLIQNALGESKAIVDAIAQSRGGVEEAAAEGSGLPEKSPGEEAGAAKTSGRLRTREEAFQTLLRVAQFFKETEPHSPISYLLERSVRWGKMPLPELLTELIAEEGSRSSVFKLVGIELPEKSEG